MCYRCSTSNPLINKYGNVCFNCKQPFVYSFISFGELFFYDQYFVTFLHPSETLNRRTFHDFIVVVIEINENFSAKKNVQFVYAHSTFREYFS